MDTVLFIIFPAYGHINAVLAIAKHLEVEGKKVLFLGSCFKHFNKYIEHQGFEVVSSDSIPFGLNYFEELTFYKASRRNFKDLLLGRISGEIYECRRNAMQEVFKTYQISVILLDSFFGADLLCYHDELKHRKITLYYITTMNPDVYSCRNHQLDDRSFRNFLPRIRLQGKNLWENCYLLGHTTMRMIRERTSEFADPQLCIRFRSRAAVLLGNYTELLVSSTLLGKTNVQYRQFVGLQVDLSRSESVESEHAKLIRSLGDSSSKPIVYISFGTLSRPHKLLKLIRRLISVASNFKQYTFLVGNVSTGVRKRMAPLVDTTDNVFVFGMVPQLWLLSRSKLFITHGGFNSLKEALMFGVPMLSLPSNDNFDQYRTAELVRSLGIGIMVPQARCKRKDMQTAVAELLDNNTFLQNAQRIKSLIRQENELFNFSSI